MAEGIYTALSGVIAQNDALDVVSNNVANAGTAGYRSSRIRFDVRSAAPSSRTTAWCAPASPPPTRARAR